MYVFVAEHMRLIYLGIAALPALAQSPSDWPTYNRDLASSRFSPLTQINPGNVDKLTLAWSYKMRPDANSPNSGTMNEVTPIVVNGVMYLPAGNRVVALDPESGKEIWRYDLENGAMASRRSRWRTGRATRITRLVSFLLPDTRWSA